jgi:hypothetical protein
MQLQLLTIQTTSQTLTPSTHHGGSTISEQIKITDCRTFRCSGQNSHFWQLWPISLFFLFYLSFTLYSIFILLNLMSFLFIPCYSFVISVANDLPGHTSPTSFIPHTAYSCPRVPKWNRFSIERIDSLARCCCSFLYY